MQLVEQGKIDLDQPLQTYIPEFAIKTRFPDAGPITIRSMMTHHSGLPGDWWRLSFTPDYPYFTALVDNIKNEYVAYPPNYIWAYSNLAVSLLGVVVERVSGQKFNDYVEGHILKPMAMNHSSFIVRDDMKPFLAKGHLNNKPVEDMPIADLPAGALYSSSAEMSNFIKMILADGRLRYF